MVELDSDFGHDGENAERSDIPWIELFIDLVFIAALIQAGDRLLHNLGVAGLAEFTVFFALAWWAWNGVTLHFARRNADHIAARLIVFIFVFAIASLGVLAGRGLMVQTAAFALFYALARFSVAILYADLAYRDKPSRRVAFHFAVGFGLGALLWAVSAWIGEPWRYAFWGLAIAAEIATGWLQNQEKIKKHLSLDASRLSERYGQLTLIVLGESFIKMTAGLVQDAGITLQSAVFSLSALIFIASVFWAYFGDIAGTTIREGRARLWTYLHLPLLMSIAALGVALSPIVAQEAGQPVKSEHHTFLHITAMAAFFWVAMIDFFGRTSDAAGGYVAGIARLASMAFLGASWFLGEGLDATLSVGIAALACALPVIAEAIWRPNAETAPRASVEKEKPKPRKSSAVRSRKMG